MEPEQAGRPLGLSPDGGRAGHEPPRPRGTGQGELGEGRRGEGRSGAGLAAPGSERDLQLPEGEQDARSAPQLAQGLLDQLDAHVAGTVRALQDDMRRVQERLSQLETLAAAQVRAGPGATRCRCRLARPLCPCWCRPGQQGSAWGGPGEGTPQGLGTHPGGAEGRPSAGGAARPGLGPRYRSSVGRTEEWPVKKKHRRRPSKKKRRWKPYSKLSWEEKQQFDERQSLRASRLRAEMFAKGQPVAPYNTTQFLMEDHDQEEPDLKTGLYPRRTAAKSEDTSEEDFLEEAAEEEDGGSDGMGGDGSEFLQRDFSETYERYHVESLQNMSKQELVKEYLELEKCLSRMEEENNRLRMESKKHG
ncbi:PREDICTED: protein HEXIM1-like, partial [Calidris pugnax]|uniref:protein HEXIM1-like n=1 Tax=Calidris pugnax TaxID=198806 RepID=UPI00071E55C4